MDAVACKVLVRDGKWLVPPEERPANWRSILPESDSPSILDEVIANTLPEAKPIELCGCGKPIVHHGTCSVRAEQAKRSREARQSFVEMMAVVDKSADEWGAHDSLRLAARVMIAGLWTRDVNALARMLRAKAGDVERICARYEGTIIWPSDRTVFIGDENEAHGDLGFWLNAMVGDGFVRISGKPGDAMYEAVREPKR